MNQRGTRTTGWRRLAGAIWPEPNDPQMLGDLLVDAGPALAFIEESRRRSGAHVTVLHVVGRSVAHALARHPELNVSRRGDRLVPRENVDVAFIVAFDDGEAHAGVTIFGVDRMSAVRLARELSERAAVLRDRPPADVRRFARATDRMPRWVLRAGLRAAVWLTVDRGVDLGIEGLHAGGFGGALVTSVGGLGIDHAYPMLTPFSRVPIALMVGRIEDRVVAVDGAPAVRPMLTIGAALDHRVLDGSHAAKLASAMRAYLADPATFEPPAREEEPRRTVTPVTQRR